MQSTTVIAPVGPFVPAPARSAAVCSLRTHTVRRLARAADLTPRTVRWLLDLADLVAAAIQADRHAALLEIAAAYRRAAQAGAASDRIRTSMLAGEQDARRLARHLS